MMHIDLGLAAALLYLAVFITAAFRAGQFQWLWAGVFMWLGISMLGASVMPGMWGITHVGPLFVPHLYITAGSLFFFVNEWRKVPELKQWALGRHGFLSLFAVSNGLMSLAFAVFCGIVWSVEPSRLTAFAWPALLKIYALQPLYWFTVQAVVMVVFYLHRSIIAKQPCTQFSRAQLQAGFLLSLLLLFAEWVLVMLEIRQ